MEPLRHTLVTFALASAVALGAFVGEARADPAHAGQPGVPASERASAAEEPADADPGARAAAPAADPGSPRAASAPAGADGGVAVPAAAPVPAKAVAGPPRTSVPPGTDGASAGERPPAAGVRKLELSLPLQIEVHGRVLVDVTADERTGWGRALEMGSARLGVEARVGGVKTVVEVDVASDPIVDDAYVRVELPRSARLTAGRFKAPFSERHLESRWTLPLVERGLVDRYLVKRNGLGGRRLGVAGALRPWGRRLEASAGFFAGDPDALEASSDAGEDWAARVAFRPVDAIEIGTTGYRAGAGSGPAAAPLRHAAGAFANVDLGRFEASVEGFAGRLAEGSFTAGTALVGYELRPGGARRLEITPVLGAETLHLGGATGGVGYGAIAGAVISWTEGLKVKVQGEWARRPGDAAPATAVAAEVGTRF